MVFFRKTLLVFLVWVTSLSTLIGGLPHLECRCANGSLKPFCISLFIDGSSCCCDGICCPSGEKSDSSEGSSRPCCCHRKSSTSKSKPINEKHKVFQGAVSCLEGTQVQNPGCAKKAAQAHHFLVGQRGILQKEMTPGPFAALLPSGVVVANPVPANHTLGQVQTSDPPTDLIILLGHLRI
jgi:hypothetical protein